MKVHQWIAALAAVGLLALALPARGQVGADGVKAQSLTGTRIVGVKADSTQEVIGADGSGSGLNVNTLFPDRTLDFNVTNLIASTALDSGGGAVVKLSAPVDVRQYSKGNIIIHITQAAAGDTAGVYDYAVTVFPLTSAVLDWTAIGVPVNTNPTIRTIEGVVAQAPDSLGFWAVTPNNQNLAAGEHNIRLRTRRASLYSNIDVASTISLPWDVWLGSGARPRYIAVQIRLRAKTITGNHSPSVRVDLEGLR